jgi:hypothetical protein
MRGLNMFCKTAGSLCFRVEFTSRCSRKNVIVLGAKLVRGGSHLCQAWQTLLLKFSPWIYQSINSLMRVYIWRPRGSIQNSTRMRLTADCRLDTDRELESIDSRYDLIAVVVIDMNFLFFTFTLFLCVSCIVVCYFCAVETWKTNWSSI